MAAVQVTTIPYKPNTANRQIENHVAAKFVPALTTLRMPGLKLSKLFFAFLGFPALRTLGKCASHLSSPYGELWRRLSLTPNEETNLITLDFCQNTLSLAQLLISLCKKDYEKLAMAKKKKKKQKKKKTKKKRGKQSSLTRIFSIRSNNQHSPSLVLVSVTMGLVDLSLSLVKGNDCICCPEQKNVIQSLLYTWVILLIRKRMFDICKVCKGQNPHVSSFKRNKVNE